MKDIISMRDFTKRDISTLLDAAADVGRALHDSRFDVEFKKKYRRSVHNLLEGILADTLFPKKSTRTLFSTRKGVQKTGGAVDGFSNPEDTSLGKGETWGETAEMFALYGSDVITMRSDIEGLPRWTKEYLVRHHEPLNEQYLRFLKYPFSYRVPFLINGGDGENQHPTQCLLDLATIRAVARSQGRELDGLHLALINDVGHSRVLGSTMSIAHLYGFKIHLAYPNKRFGPKPHQIEDLIRNGVEFYDHGQDKEAAMVAAFIAIHSRPQKERIGKGEDFEAIKQWGIIDRALYDKLGDQAPLLMHPKPVDAETFEEIYYDMNIHPKNISNLQASIGPYVRIALHALGVGRMQADFDYQDRESIETNLEELPLSSESKELTNPRSGFIENEGVVIDHIPQGKGRRLAGILGFEDSDLPVVFGSSIFVGEEGRQPYKDMLKVHCAYEFSQGQYEAIALQDPKISVSFVRNGDVFGKVRPILGNHVTNRVICGNENCVANVRKEHVTKVHHVEKANGQTVLRCKWCEVADTVDQIYDGNRFIYSNQEEAPMF